MDIPGFRKLRDDSRIYEMDQGVLREETFWGKLWRYIVKWFCCGKTNTHVIAAKQMLANALGKAEGGDRASEAMRKVFGKDWEQDDLKQLTGRSIHQVLDAARQMRMKCILRNRQLAKKFTSYSHMKRLPTISKGNFKHYARIKDRIMQSIMRHPDFYKRDLTEAKIEHLINEAIESYKQEVSKTFARQHPGLSQIADMLKIEDIRDETMLDKIKVKITQMISNYMDSFQQLKSSDIENCFRVFNEARKFNDMPALEVHEAYVKSGKMVEHIRSAISPSLNSLDDIKKQALEKDDNSESLEIKIIEALKSELVHTRRIEKSNHGMLQNLLKTNPRSDKNIGYARVMQTLCRNKALKNLISELKDQGAPPEQIKEYMELLGGLKADLRNLMDQYYEKGGGYKFKLDDKEADPAVIYKAKHETERACEHLNDMLKDLHLYVGAPAANWRILKIKPEDMECARIQVLNISQEWPTIDNSIVHKGVSYDQSLDYAVNLRPEIEADKSLSYAAWQLDQAGLKGFSIKIDPNEFRGIPRSYFRDIPRNLQHSTLTVGSETKIDMLRHAAITNQEQALVIISTAMWTDPQLRAYILDHLDTDPSNDNKKLPLIDYDFCHVYLMNRLPPGKRREIQDRHFQVFKELSEQQEPVKIPFIDRQGIKCYVGVNLSISATWFYVPGNVASIEATKVSTRSQDLWKDLEESNRTGLERLLGDLGDPQKSFEGSARGTPVGGMIGKIVTALNKTLGKQEEALTRLEERWRIRREELEQWDKLKNDFKKQLLGLKDNTEDLELQLKQEIPEERVPWLMREETRKGPEGSEGLLEKSQDEEAKSPDSPEPLLKKFQALFKMEEKLMRIVEEQLRHFLDLEQEEEAFIKKRMNALKRVKKKIWRIENLQKEALAKKQEQTTEIQTTKQETEEDKLRELQMSQIEIESEINKLKQEQKDNTNARKKRRAGIPPPYPESSSQEAWEWHQRWTRHLQEELDDLREPAEHTSYHSNIETLRELRHNIQEAVDIVRDSYCSGSYKTNNTSPGPFPLAVMYANTLAKQASTELERYKGTPRNVGFGMSLGSLDNQEHAGYLDALVKSLAISPDNAIKLLRFNPDSHAKLSPYELASMIKPLPPKDAANLLVIGLLYTGQLQDWQAKNIIMRSKHADQLMAVIEQQHPKAYEILQGLS